MLGINRKQKAGVTELTGHATIVISGFVLYTREATEVDDSATLVKVISVVPKFK